MNLFMKCKSFLILGSYFQVFRIILLHPVDVPHKLQQPAVKIFPYTLAKQHLSWLALGDYFGAHFILGLIFGYLGLDHAAVGNFKTQHPLSGS